MPDNFLKIKETHYNATVQKTMMVENITYVNLSTIQTITYSKIKDIESDYVTISFGNNMVFGMVVN